ncbi:MAG: hypothetical protein ABL872_02170 [Lacibacter sp.]
MKKRVASAVIAMVIGFLFTSLSAQTVRKEKLLVPAKESTVNISANMVVPAGETYFVYNAAGVLTATYNGGSTLIVPLTNAKKKKALNCVEISCPKSFRKGTVCWRCR